VCKHPSEPFLFYVSLIYWESFMFLTILYLMSSWCSVGYFIEPTLVSTTNPKNKLMEEVRVDTRLLGRVVDVYCYYYYCRRYLVQC